MLIDVFAGPDRRTAAPRGCYHFVRSPAPGEQVEIAGEILTVANAWHTPATHYAGAKFAILVGDATIGGEPAMQCHEDAGAVI
ncbi:MULTISPECIES: hypothetical protein [Sphingomonadaceae]|uniref:hypothetical protein n=1 Tax=Sphingomonadales TaxID=204457 RepID=UPI00076FF40A|nr:hypothetical protein [Sphingobium sp. TKS]AMK23050.1 hypothetical protein K426_10540 [Sphingobium sp. TKS]MCF8707837.1 hypothetical protein [Rhizorhapis sp. SPR117]